MEEFIIENLTTTQLDILESSDIEYAPDIVDGCTNIVVFSKDDLEKALELIGR